MAPLGAHAPRQIRRYDNRKLYDAAARRYVTLDQLRGYVASGDEVEVLDQKTGEDLTTLTLAQILLEGLRGSTARVPRQVLNRLIRLSFGPRANGGETGAAAPQEAAAQARKEAERIVGGLLAKGRLTLEEALALRQELSGSVHQIVAEAQAGFEAGFRSLFGSHDGPHASLQGLKDRIEALSARVGPAPSRTRSPRAKATAPARPNPRRKK